MQLPAPNPRTSAGRPASGGQPGGAGATTIPGIDDRLTHDFGSCGAFFSTTSLGARGARVEAAGMGPAGRRCRGWRGDGAAPLAGDRLGLSARAATRSVRLLHIGPHGQLELVPRSGARCRLAAEQHPHKPPELGSPGLPKQATTRPDGRGGGRGQHRAGYGNNCACPLHYNRGHQVRRSRPRARLWALIPCKISPHRAFVCSMQIPRRPACGSGCVLAFRPALGLY